MESKALWLRQEEPVVALLQTMPYLRTLGISLLAFNRGVHEPIDEMSQHLVRTTQLTALTLLTANLPYASFSALTQLENLQQLQLQISHGSGQLRSLCPILLTLTRLTSLTLERVPNLDSILQFVQYLPQLASISVTAIHSRLKKRRDRDDEERKARLCVAARRIGKPQDGGPRALRSFSCQSQPVPGLLLMLLAEIGVELTTLSCGSTMDTPNAETVDSMEQIAATSSITSLSFQQMDLRQEHVDVLLTPGTLQQLQCLKLSTVQGERFTNLRINHLVQLKELTVYHNHVDIPQFELHSTDKQLLRLLLMATDSLPRRPHERCMLGGKRREIQERLAKDPTSDTACCCVVAANIHTNQRSLPS